MKSAVLPYTPERVAAVQAFNARLDAAGLRVRLSTSPVSGWLPKLPGRKLYQESFVAADDAGLVRGGYVLKHQDFSIDGRLVSVGDFQMPVSEGAIDRRWAPLGVQLLRDALQKSPLLYGLGMGSRSDPVVRLLEGANWQLCVVPFFFRIVRPFAVLRNLRWLRRTRGLRWACDALALSGLGPLAIRAAQAAATAAATRRARPDPAVTAERVEEFGDWADGLWEACKPHYPFAAVRDAETLRILYPRHAARFLRLRLLRQGRPIGWAVLLDTQMAGHRQFGDLRVGSLVDCLAAPADAAAVVREARSLLEAQGVDLLVSNQAHYAWCRALADTGFLRGPSNFYFASSLRLTGMLHAAGIRLDHYHINRGDGDGPINL